MVYLLTFINKLCDNLNYQSNHHLWSILKTFIEVKQEIYSELPKIFLYDLLYMNILLVAHNRRFTIKSQLNLNNHIICYKTINKTINLNEVNSKIFN